MSLVNQVINIELGEKEAILFRTLQKYQKMLAKDVKESQKHSQSKEDEEID